MSKFFLGGFVSLLARFVILNFQIKTVFITEYLLTYKPKGKVKSKNLSPFQDSQADFPGVTQMTAFSVSFQKFPKHMPSIWNSENHSCDFTTQLALEQRGFELCVHLHTDLFNKFGPIL